MAGKFLDYTGLAYLWSKIKDYIDSHSGGVTVDSALDSTSENPVQNKAIKAAIDASKTTVKRTSLSANAVSVPSGTWTALCTFTGKANTSYYIFYGAAFASNASGYRQLHIGVNSNTAGRYSPSYAAVSGDQTRLQGAIVYNFSGAGTITLWARQNSGSALNVYGWYEAMEVS